MDPFSSVAVSDPVPVPLVGWAVHAGFPSPAEDHSEGSLDLTRKFVRNPVTTFVVRATGESLTGLGIRPGDFLLVDRSRHPRDGDVVVAIVDGQFTAKQYALRRGRIALLSANPDFPALAWGEGCEIWGVVTSVHRDLLQR
jgi:DNA polymerase V